MPRPSHIKWRLLRGFRRPTAGRPMSAPPLFARIQEPSTHPRDQSSSPAAFSSASRMRYNSSKTPAAFPPQGSLLRRAAPQPHHRCRKLFEECGRRGLLHRPELELRRAVLALDPYAHLRLPARPLLRPRPPARAPRAQPRARCRLTAPRTRARPRHLLRGPPPGCGGQPRTDRARPARASTASRSALRPNPQPVRRRRRAGRYRSWMRRRERSDWRQACRLLPLWELVGTRACVPRWERPTS